MRIFDIFLDRIEAFEYTAGDLRHHDAHIVGSTNSKCCNPVGKFEEKFAYTIFH